METNFENNELELMRKQLDLLKEKLSNQEIVNNRLMREAMRKRMSWINSFVKFEFAMLPLIAIGLLGCYKVLGLPAPALIFLMVVCVVDMIIDYKVNKIKPKQWAEGELIDISRRLTKMKKMRIYQTLVGIIILALWLVWICLDTDTSEITKTPEGCGALIGGLVGMVIGAFVALILNWKMNKTNDQLIKEIENMND